MLLAKIAEILELENYDAHIAFRHPQFRST